MKVRFTKANATLIRPFNDEEGLSQLKFIENMARISHKSEELQGPETWRRFITSVVLEHGDWSVVEHASATVIFQVNRGITHELVRHRLFGFTQESTRFVNYSHPKHEPVFIPSIAVDEADRTEWEEDLETAEAIYKKWLSRKYAPQIARDHLPNALAATIAVTGNLRNWRHALIMRTTKETHIDFRNVMTPLLTQFQMRIPILFDDISPMQKQSEAIQKAR
jgi:thymidylate synthase (FAD)